MEDKLLIYFPLLVFLFFIVKASAKSNNVCTTWIDYFIINHSKNCYYNPDVFSNGADMLKRHVGKYENHTVTTEDGYILHLFRVFKKNPKGVVILQHPVTADSTVFLLQGNESIVLSFLNLGYEVWLPNHRGTPFSQKHVNLNTNNPRYWDFSFHEIAIHDYSSIIKYIKTTTNRSDLIFVGHSMSSTSALIYSSLKPKEAKDSVKVFILMGPAAYLRTIGFAPNFAAQAKNFLMPLLNLFGFHAIFTARSLKLSNEIQVAIPLKITVAIIDWAFGWNPEEFEPKLVNLFLSDGLKTTALKILYHYAQLGNNGGVFRMYDYGKKINMIKYNLSTPPEYPVENINVPIYLIAGTKDVWSTYEDAMYLFNNKLSKEAKIYGLLKADGINHGDYQWGKSRFEKLYNPIFKLLSKIGFD